MRVSNEDGTESNQDQAKQMYVGGLIAALGQTVKKFGDVDGATILEALPVGSATAAALDHPGLHA
jgi:hypothetical protein